MLWAHSNRQLARWWWIHLHKLMKSEKSTRGPALKWAEWCRNTSADSQHCSTSVIVHWSSGCHISLWVKHCSLWQQMLPSCWWSVHSPPLPTRHIYNLQLSCKASKLLSSHHLVSHTCIATHICQSQSCPCSSAVAQTFLPFSDTSCRPTELLYNSISQRKNIFNSNLRYLLHELNNSSLAIITY